MTPEEIKEIRTRRGWSVTDLADAIFVDKLTVARWEAGLNKPLPGVQRRLRELLTNARQRDGGK